MLDGLASLVTGANRGIGRAIALALADAGSDVAVGVRRVGAGADVVAESEARGRRAVEVLTDVRDLDGSRAGLDEAVAAAHDAGTGGTIVNIASQAGLVALPTEVTGTGESAVAADGIVVSTSLFTAVTGEGGLTLVDGYAGSDVLAVVVHTGDGGDVAATVSAGRFLAWWPTSAAAVSYTLTFRDGTVLSEVQPAR